MLNDTKKKTMPMPPKFEDLEIKYRGDLYWGYYLGNDEWRVGTSSDGKYDIYVSTELIDSWKLFYV
jgi:hypothetical protein